MACWRSRGKEAPGAAQVQPDAVNFKAADDLVYHAGVCESLAHGAALAQEGPSDQTHKWFA